MTHDGAPIVCLHQYRRTGGRQATATGYARLHATVSRSRHSTGQSEMREQEHEEREAEDSGDPFPEEHRIALH